MKKFLGVYYEGGHDAKGPYTEIPMDKVINKLLDGYEKFIGRGRKVSETPGFSGTTLSKSDI